MGTPWLTLLFSCKKYLYYDITPRNRRKHEIVCVTQQRLNSINQPIINTMYAAINFMTAAQCAVLPSRVHFKLKNSKLRLPHCAVESCTHVLVKIILRLKLEFLYIIFTWLFDLQITKCRI